MKISALLVPLLLAGCASARPKPAARAPKVSLTSARQGFKTRLISSPGTRDAVPLAPAKVFSTVKYPASHRGLAAYVSPDPLDGKKHPAIVWITGGDCNSIGDVWSPQNPANDQSASAFRKAGIVMMFPSLRGGNINPGRKEGFLGEVNDVLAAADWLSKRPYVDPKRIYLGGHSTGGTLALLVAESSNRFRATFAFGPVEDVSGYGSDSGFLPFDLENEREVRLRSPGYWLASVASPTWVIEGTERGNLDSLRAMQSIARELPPNPNLHFLAVEGASHFSVLAPTNALLARKILADKGAKCNISLSEAELKRTFATFAAP